ncbi:MAG TPA: hypothetical protein VJT70_07735 [Sphingomicrobium sp.]|nr:hypothetical protein [Sphingomicrobium sp.]
MRTSAEWFDRQRPLIGKLLFEVVIVFIGVTAAFALEAARQDRQEAEYRERMLGELATTLNDTIQHNQRFEAQVDKQLAEFDAALVRGEQPKLPIYREPGSERPPTRIWDGVVSTGAAKALDPNLFYGLATLYTRLDSFGERYVRYNDFTEQHVFPLGPEQAGIYDPESGRLKPEFAAYVDRLRDLAQLSKELDKKAAALKVQLDRLQ